MSSVLPRLMVWELPEASASCWRTGATTVPCTPANEPEHYRSCRKVEPVPRHVHEFPSQLHLVVDQTRPRIGPQDGRPLTEVFDTLQTNFGSLYVNDFNRFGRTWQVNVQADSEFRMRQEDLKRLKVHSSNGGMVPLASVARIEEVRGPVLITRYNLYPTAAINFDVAPGVSSGQGLAAF